MHRIRARVTFRLPSRRLATHAQKPSSATDSPLRKRLQAVRDAPDSDMTSSASALRSILAAQKARPGIFAATWRAFRDRNLAHFGREHVLTLSVALIFGGGAYLYLTYFDPDIVAKKILSDELESRLRAVRDKKIPLDSPEGREIWSWLLVQARNEPRLLIAMVNQMSSILGEDSKDWIQTFLSALKREGVSFEVGGEIGEDARLQEAWLLNWAAEDDPEARIAAAENVLEVGALGLKPGELLVDGVTMDLLQRKKELQAILDESENQNKS